MRLYLQRRAIRLGSFRHLLVAAVKNIRAPAVKGLSVDGSAPFIRDERSDCSARRTTAS
jgi:hypothetical protein